VTGDVLLDIPPRPAFLSLARQVEVAAARNQPGFGEERLEKLRLAVSEATSNAIRAHDRIGSSERIRISCRLGEGRIEVDVIDHGPGFDPDSLPLLPPPADPARLLVEGGLGIPLMRWCTDRTEIVSGPTGTQVRLVVYAVPELA
jgi:anti-sigma regulatory factor (Ser/Thr protein kinase)